MGCVIYYVLSGGKHPFGAPFLRQANIEAGNYALTDLSGVSKCQSTDGCMLCSYVIIIIIKILTVCVYVYVCQ